ncbi:MAG: hypothetical protein HUU16_21915, partial [Candidatus Omnitrophica bacterium]|nr:hypothetical protein [Candidatus Omnitrophota bacterium]
LVFVSATFARGAVGTETGPTPTPCPFVGPCVKAVTLEVSCVSPIVDNGATLDFILASPLGETPFSCDPSPCDPILTCRIPCGLIQAPTCPFPAQILAGLLTDCLNAEGSGNVCVSAGASSSHLRIEANFDFACCVDSDEFDLPPGLAYPLTPVCRLSNLCDETPFNEQAEPVAGIGLALSNAPCACECAEAATLTFACTETLFEPECLLTLLIGVGETEFKAACGPSSCTDTIASCTLLLSELVPPAARKSSDDFCSLLSEAISERVVECLRAQISDSVQAATASGGRVVLTSCLPLRWCVCADEIPACKVAQALPLSAECAVVNLCDGTEGNEIGGENLWTGGLAVFYELGPCPEPMTTPTPTSTETEPPGATPTPSQSATPSATPEEGATATATPTQPGAPTPTPTDEFKPLGCDIGFYMLDSFGGRHRVGNPETIEGPLFFGTDLARDMELVSLVEFSGSPSRGLDLVVLDAFGAAHYVAHDVTIPQDFVFPADPMFPEGRAVDIETAFDGLGFWVLTDFGGIYRAGSTKDPGDPGLVPGTDRMGTLGFDVPYGGVRAPTLPNPGGASLRAVALAVIDTNSDSRAEGYILIDSQGGRYQMLPNGNPVPPNAFIGEPLNSPLKLLDPAAYVWPFFPGLDIARDCELHPSGQGVVILDGWGGIHPVPVDGVSNPVFFANNRNPDAPATLLTTVGLPYITSGFDDPSTPPDESNEAVFGRDAASIFKDLEFCRDGRAGMYVMDRFGGVFAFGEARGEPDNLAAPFEGIPFFFPHLYAEDMETFSPAQAETEP